MVVNLDLPARLQLHLQHRYRRTWKIQHFVQEPHEVRVQVVRHWETSGALEKSRTSNNDKDTDEAQRNTLRHTPEWLDDSTENLVEKKSSVIHGTHPHVRNRAP